MVALTAVEQLRAFIELVSVTAAGMQTALNTPFGSHAAFVATQELTYQADDERELAGRTAAAKERLGHSAPTEDVVAAARSLELIRRNDITEQIVDCFVCGMPAVVEGAIDVEVDWDIADGEAIVAGAYPVFEAQHYHCRTCGITLDTAALIKLSGVMDHWTLSSADLDEWELEQAAEEAAFYE